MPIIPALRRQRQGDCEFKASLRNIEKLKTNSNNRHWIEMSWCPDVQCNTCPPK
jgi:hypothetical protein